MKFFYSWLPLIFLEPLWLWGFLLIGFIIILFLGLRAYVWWRQQSVVFKPWKQNFESGRKEPISPFIKFSTITILASLLGFWWWQIPGFVLGLVGSLVLSVGWQKRHQNQKQQQITQQLPLFLRALGSTLKAGYSVPQALEFVAGEVENPLKKELLPGAKSLSWQQPLAEVLTDWKARITVPEFKFLADSLGLQSRRGGNLVTLCHRVAYLLEERAKLERDIASFTAQGKMSGLLMAGLWPISLLLFAWLSPSHTEVLFSTLRGQFLLGLSFSLELIGFYFMWRLVRLKI